MSKIIDFNEEKKRTGLIETSYTRKNSRNWICKHERLELDENTRVVECLDCGDRFDSFDVLLMYANQERKTKRDIDRLEAAIAEFNAIKAEWSPTIKEKRRISKAMETVCHAW